MIVYVYVIYLCVGILDLFNKLNYCYSRLIKNYEIYYVFVWVYDMGFV